MGKNDKAPKSKFDICEFVNHIKKECMDLSSPQAKAAANIGVSMIVGIRQIVDAIDRQTSVEVLHLQLGQRMASGQLDVMGQVGDILKGMKHDTDDGEAWKRGYTEDDEDDDS